jgi:uncharacterized membrane protein
MMTGNVAQQALGIGTTSPYPQSFDGSGLLFWCALFAMIVISALASMLGGLLANHITRDRRSGFDHVAALRLQVFAMCIFTIMLCLPNAVYMISYGEATPATLQAILIFKRAIEAASIPVAIAWMALYSISQAGIILKLRSPNSMIWQDHKLASLKRFGWVVVLSAGLAASVTIGVAFR